jgi:signal transduction histidine kinase
LAIIVNSMFIRPIPVLDYGMLPDMDEKAVTTRSNLKSLAEVSSLINSSLEIQMVLANAMTCVQTFMDAEASAIFELDRDRGELFFRTALGDAAEKLRDVRIQLGEGIAGWVAQTGEPVIVSDAHQDPRFYRMVDSRTGFKTRAILCVPMVSKGQIVGVLEVLNKRGDQDFTEDDLETLTILGNLIAIALENAKLYTRLSERFVLTEEELKTTQAKLIRSERLAALGKLSAGVAHEVRNPVMVIGGFARRLHKQYADVEAVRKSTEVIISETERLERMVVDIENLCKLRQPILLPVSVGSMVEHLIQDLANSCQAQGIEIKVNSRTRMKEIQADEGLLRIALKNIANNAIEAMPNGGLLELDLDDGSDGLVITIKDRGVGIAPDDLPNVFDPFSTSKTRGSGLGLTAAHRIASDHGGEIAINSTLGQGTEVRILLPCRWQACR